MQAAMVSIAEVIKDIAPLYPISLKETEEKLHTQIKKEERSVLVFEKELITFYDKYIQVLLKVSNIKGTPLLLSPPRSLRCS